MPHAERANTASFLEEVITYIQGLQKRISELEQGRVTQTPATQAAPASTGNELGLCAASGGPPASLQPPPTQVSPRAPPTRGPPHVKSCPQVYWQSHLSLCTSSQVSQPEIAAQPLNAQPSTPPALSGEQSTATSSDANAMPFKKRRVMEGGSG